MNKTELVAAVAAKAELSKKDAEAAVNAVFDSVKDALAEGDKVLLSVSVLSQLRLVQLVQALILAQRKQSKFLNQRFLHLRQVQLLRML
jgi:hypothetical protein